MYLCSCIFLILICLFVEMGYVLLRGDYYYIDFRNRIKEEVDFLDFLIFIVKLFNNRFY